MILEILIAIFLGIIAGIFTGLIPGIHINLVAILAFSLSTLLLQITSPIIIAIFIVSVAITHTFLDFIPSVFLGAPEESTALSVLPAHKLLLKGRGYEAIKLTTIGSLLGLIIALAIVPTLIFTVPKIYPLIKTFIPYILILASLFLITKEHGSKFWALASFLIAGILGLGVLNIPLLKQPLLPMLSGLFGTSNLILSINNKVNIPKQIITQTKIRGEQIVKALSSGLIASTITGLLPGVGAAQAAIIGSSIFKKITTKTFLILVGSINTIVMIISFIALYTINKARNGAIVIVSKILETFNTNYLLLFLASTLIVGGIATFLTLLIGKNFAKFITKVNYRTLCLSIIALIGIVTFIFSSFLGLFILTISTFVGIIPPITKIGRNHLMGCLILPVILYFLL